jgi:hypothetical protein
MTNLHPVGADDKRLSFGAAKYSTGGSTASVSSFAALGRVRDRARIHRNALARDGALRVGTLVACRPERPVSIIPAKQRDEKNSAAD